MITISRGGLSAKSSANNFIRCSGCKQNDAASVTNLPGTRQVISFQFGSYVFINNSLKHTLRHYLSYPSEL